jgi:3-oxoadipate enol-lactonase
MAYLNREPGTDLYYNHVPARAGFWTFAFMNSSGASAAVWEKEIVPALTARGYGTIVIDYRGQGQSRYTGSASFTQEEIVADATAVLDACRAKDLVLVGISIGGIHAARVWQGGVPCVGMVLVNTLRKHAPVTSWLAELEYRLLEIGGPRLLHDVFRPVTVAPGELAQMRDQSLLDRPYEPAAPDLPRFRLQDGARRVNWDFPWQDLTCPVLVMTGMHDRLFRVQSHVDELAARIKDVTVADFADDGHALHTENPARFVEELDAFARSRRVPTP